jgi:hypothetical protein
MIMPADKQQRPLYEIAREITEDASHRAFWWKAEPYVSAMSRIDKITDVYMYEPADMVVRYALGNLMGWRGDKAKAIKDELRSML